MRQRGRVDPALAPWNALADANGLCLILSSECLVACVNAIIKLVDGWTLGRLLVMRCAISFLLNLVVCVASELPRPTAHELPRLVMRGVAYCAFMAFFFASLRSCVPIGDVVVRPLPADPPNISPGALAQRSCCSKCGTHPSQTINYTVAPL